MRLVVSDITIKYEPSFSDFEISLVNLIEIIIKACSYIPRVETRLYSDSQVSKDHRVILIKIINLCLLKNLTLFC
jgi:hypothetical protein